MPTHAVPDAAATLAGCEKRIAKGGSWGTLTHNRPTAERPPTQPDDSIGIRVAKTAP